MPQIRVGRYLPKNYGGVEMKDLNLPDTSSAIPQPDRILSMEEYLEFVQFHIENLFDQESYSRWKETIAVNAPFKL
mgnify:CR=1 FL=1